MMILIAIKTGRKRGFAPGEAPINGEFGYLRRKAETGGATFLIRFLMYTTKQISLSLLLLSSGVILASAEQKNSNQNHIDCTRLHDRKIDICNLIGEKKQVTIAPQGSTGSEIEQQYKDFEGFSTQDTVSIFPGSGKRLVRDRVYTFEELQSLMLPHDFLYVLIKKAN